MQETQETGFDPWVGKIPWSRKWQPTPVFMPRKFHGQRSLVGYNPWGRKASDANENTHNNPVYTQHRGVLRGREPILSSLRTTRRDRDLLGGRWPTRERHEYNVTEAFLGSGCRGSYSPTYYQLCDLDKLLSRAKPLPSPVKWANDKTSS